VRRARSNRNPHPLSRAHGDRHGVARDRALGTREDAAERVRPRPHAKRVPRILLPAVGRPRVVTDEALAWPKSRRRRQYGETHGLRRARAPIGGVRHAEVVRTKRRRDGDRARRPVRQRERQMRGIARAETGAIRGHRENERRIRVRRESAAGQEDKAGESGRNARHTDLRDALHHLTIVRRATSPFDTEAAPPRYSLAARLTGRLPPAAREAFPPVTSLNAVPCTFFQPDRSAGTGVS
jgi:hypothetical protein